VLHLVSKASEKHWMSHNEYCESFFFYPPFLSWKQFGGAGLTDGQKTYQCVGELFPDEEQFS